MVICYNLSSRIDNWDIFSGALNHEYSYIHVCGNTCICLWPKVIVLTIWFELRNKCTFCEIKWSRNYLMLMQTTKRWEQWRKISLTMSKYEFYVIPFTFWIQSAHILHKRIAIYIITMACLSFVIIYSELLTRVSLDNGLSSNPT